MVAPIVSAAAATIYASLTGLLVIALDAGRRYVMTDFSYEERHAVARRMRELMLLDRDSYFDDILLQSILDELGEGRGAIGFVVAEEEQN